MIDPCGVRRKGLLEVVVTLRSETQKELRSTDAKDMAARMGQAELPRCAWSGYGARGYMTRDGKQVPDGDLIKPGKTTGGFFTQEHILKGMP